MMDKNRFSLALFISFFLLSVSSFAQCCVDVDNAECGDVGSSTECAGSYYNFPCNEFEGGNPCEMSCLVCAGTQPTTLNIITRVFTYKIIGCPTGTSYKTTISGITDRDACEAGSGGIFSENFYPKVSGRVFEKSGTPVQEIGVPSATVKCGSNTEQTGNEGKYEITCDVIGSNVVVSAQKGALSGQRTISTLNAHDDIKGVDIELQGATATYLYVNVTLNNAPVAGATVLVTGPGGYSATDDTDAKGIAEFPKAPRQSTVTITASKTGLPSSPPTLRLLTKSTQIERVPLPTGTPMVISGYILNGSTTPKETIAGAKVDIVPAGGTTVIASSTSDQNGKYSVTVQEGAYEVSVTKEKFSPKTVAVPEENYGKFNISLIPSVGAGINALLKMLVVDSLTKKGIQNVEVTFIKNGYVTKSVKTPESGLIETSVPTGKYLLRLTHNNYEKKEFNYEIYNNMVDQEIVEMAFIPNIAVSGTVTDNKGNAISGAAVRIDDKSYFTGTFGQFRFERNVDKKNKGYLVVSATGYATNGDTFIPAGRDTDINFEIKLSEQKCSSLSEIGELDFWLKKLDKTEATFQWESTCSADRFRIYRRDLSGEVSLIESPLGSVTTYFDDSLEPGNTYYYWIEGDYSFGYGTKKTLISKEVEVKVGPIVCFDGDKKFCSGGKSYECKDGFIVDGEPCGDNKICMETGDYRGTMCVTAQNCELCNRPFGVFSRSPTGTLFTLTSSVFGGIGFWEPLFEYSPSTSQTKFNCMNKDVPCYRDSSETVADKNYDCSQITSCYDYVSADACSQNKCLKSQNCEPVESAYSELGITVCRPQKKENQRCEAFNEGRRVSNSVFSSDSAVAASAICSLYKSDNGCVYSEFRKKCIDKEDLSCMDYNNYDSCLGKDNPQAVDVNVTWSPYYEKIKGSNNILKYSNDDAGIGICQYIDEIEDVFPGGCMRNADDSPATMGGSGLDCEDFTDDKCLADNTPPITHIFSNRKVKQMAFDYDVQDRYSKQNVVTYYSVYSLAEEEEGLPARLYPSTEAINGKISDYSLEEGNYWVYYFSQDPAKNLEPIRKFPLEIDKTSPEIKLKFITKPDLEAKEVTLTVNLELPDYRETGIPNDQYMYCINDSTTGLWKFVTSGANSFWQPKSDLRHASSIDGSLGTSFTDTYANIPTGESNAGIKVQYRWKCYDEAGNIADNFGYYDENGGYYYYTFNLDTDSTFTEPMPDAAVKERNDVEISIKTQNKGDCRFSPYNNGLYDSWTRFTKTGEDAEQTETGYIHSGTYSVGSGIENQQLYVACIFEGLDDYIQGLNGEDDISITIDDQKPDTLIKDVKTDEEIESSLSDIWVSDKGDNARQVKLVCRDKKQNYVPGESGCDAIYYCTGTSCSDFSKEATTFQLPIPSPDILDVSFYSTDKVGNQENTRTVKLKYDAESPNLTLAPPFDKNFETKYESQNLGFTIVNERKSNCEKGCEVSYMDREGTYYQISLGTNVVKRVNFTLGNYNNPVITRSSIPVQLVTNSKNTFKLFSKDEAGNTAVKTVEIIHDSVGPDLGAATVRQKYINGMDVEYGENMNLIVENVQDLKPGDPGPSPLRVSSVWMEDMFGAKYMFNKISGRWEGTITTANWPVTTPEFPTYLTLYANDTLGNIAEKYIDFSIKDNKDPSATITVENMYGGEKQTLTKGENFVVIKASESLRNVTLRFEISANGETTQFPIILTARDYDALTWVGFVDIPENYSGIASVEGRIYDLNGRFTESFTHKTIFVNSLKTISPEPNVPFVYGNGIYNISQTTPLVPYHSADSEKTYQVTVNGKTYSTAAPEFNPGINNVQLRTEDTEHNYEIINQVVNMNELLTSQKADTTPPAVAEKYYFMLSNILDLDGKWIANVSKITIEGPTGEAADVYVIGADKFRYDSTISENHYVVDSIRLIGNTFKETENVLRLIFEDSSGNTAERQITVISDLRPPHLVSLNFTRRA